jgi:DNA-binding transcriptional ArsR family regulator
MRKRKSGPENLFVSTSEEILIALLDGDLSCGKLAERVGITEQHLSRLLPRLEDHQLIYSKYPKMQRINRLTPKGRLVALLALEKKRALEKIQVSEEQVQELKVWAGEDIKRRR